LSDLKDLKDSKNMKAAKEGILLEQYTQNGWFVKVKATALVIDKVLFSFVKKGQNGAGFDVYMDIDKFDLWCDDILSGRVATIITAEKKAGITEPKDIKYITGENGAKYVGICPSTLGKAFGTISGKGLDKNGKVIFGYVPVSYDDLRIMAKRFKRVSIIRYEALDAAYKKAILDGADKNNKDANEPEYAPPVEGEENTHETKTGKFTTKGAIKERPNGTGKYSCQAVDEEKNLRNFVLPSLAELSEELKERFLKWVDISAQSAVELSVTYYVGEENGRTVYYVTQYNV